MTNEEIDDMLSKIDSIARNFDIYEYGLPMGHDGCLLEMRQAVKETLKPMEDEVAALQKERDELVWVLKWNLGALSNEDIVAAYESEMLLNASARMETILSKYTTKDL